MPTLVGMSILETEWVWRRPEAERRRLTQTLSQEQRDNVARRLRGLRMRYGRSGLAAGMGLTYDGMRKTLKRSPTMRVAVLVAYGAPASSSRTCSQARGRGMRTRCAAGRGDAVDFA